MGSLRKVVSVILTLALVACVFSGVSAFADTTSTSDYSMGRVHIDDVPLKSFSSMELDGAATPRTADVNEYPTSYSSVEKGYITEVKDQGNYGTCWAHGAAAAAEASMIKNMGYDRDTIDLSELHLAYYHYSSSFDPLDMLNGDSNSIAPRYASEGCLDMGGTNMSTPFTYARWTGVTDEAKHSDFSYSKANRYFSAEDEQAYSLDETHLEDAYWVSCADIQDMKYMIMQYGAGTIGYYHSDYYLNAATGAYYYGGSQYANHEVTVVGWDDNFSKDDFGRSAKPDENGAWLVKNSWDTTWGNDGYFWMSYEDTGLCRENASFYSFGAADNFDNNYQYDGTSLFDYEEVGKNAMMANVFTADSNEELKAISFWTAQNDVDYSVQVYTNVNSSDPSNGQPAFASEIVGNQAYAGYHTIKLPASINLPEGTKYSVVVTLTCNSESVTDLFIDKTDSSWGWVIFKNTTNAGESFYKRASDSMWTDKSASGINYRIKAFTDELNGTVVDSDTAVDTNSETSDDVSTELGALDGFDPVFDIASLKTGDRIVLLDDARSIAAIPQPVAGIVDAVEAQEDVSSVKSLTKRALWTVIKMGDSIYLANESGKQLAVSNGENAFFTGIGSQLSFNNGYHAGGFVISAQSSGKTSYFSYDDEVSGFRFFSNYTASSEYTVEFAVYKANFAVNTPAEAETLGEYNVMTDVSSLANGDRVVLFNNAYMQALLPKTLADKSTVLATESNLNSGDDFTKDMLWTVVKENGKTYLANKDGLKLAAANSNTVALNAEGSDIAFEEGSVGGTFRVTTSANLSTKRFLRFNESISGYRFYTAADISSNFTVYKYTETVVERKEVMLGDLNGDGEVTMMDVVDSQRLISGLLEETVVAKTASDFNADGKTNMEDIVFMQRVLAGLEGSFMFSKTVVTL